MKHGKWILLALGAVTLLGTAMVSAVPARGFVSDGSFAEIAKLVASGGAPDDQFGSGIAMAGDTLVVGAPNAAQGRGAAYVFIKPPGGWTYLAPYAAKLVPSDGAGGDAFGAFVDVQGDTILIGSYLHDAGADEDRGQAYVFVKPAGGWQGTLTENARLYAQGGAATDYFGVAAAVSELQDVVVVGAHHADDSRGAAYVFVKPASGWNGDLFENAKLSHVGAEPGEFLGRDADISGDTIVVGGYGVDGWSGRSYVYLKPADGWQGVLTEDAVLRASDGGGEFGSQAAISGDTIVIGAYANQKAYVYDKPVAGWQGTLTENAQLVRAKNSWGDFFGYALDIDETIIAVGAFQASFPSQAKKGAAYVFERPAGGWQGSLTETERLLASDGRANDEFGLHIAVSGDTVAVGARLADFAGVANQGSVYLYAQGAPVSEADLKIFKTFVLATNREIPSEFHLMVENAGPAQAREVEILDPLPQSVRVTAVSSANANCAITGHFVRCTKSRLKAGRTLEVVIAVQVPAHDTLLENCARVKSSVHDPRPNNNRVCITIGASR